MTDLLGETSQILTCTDETLIKTKAGTGGCNKENGFLKVLTSTKRQFST